MSHHDTPSQGVSAPVTESPDDVRITSGIRYFGTVLSDPTASPEELRAAYRSLLVLKRQRDAVRRRYALAELAAIAADHRRRRADVLAEFAALLPAVR